MAEPTTETWQLPVEEHCYRHPKEITRVHCTRCGRPICPDCMHPAPVGHHCPTCVAEEGRRDPGVRRGRARVFLARPGAITSALLAVNVGVFLLEVVLGGPGSLLTGPSLRTLLDLGAIYPPAVAAGQYWRFLTAMFLHAGLIHLLLNMYALYLFGYLIEAAFGKPRFIAIYFVSGFLASVASYSFSGVETVGVGASGAIFGLLGAWLAYNWRRRQLASASANLRWVLFLLLINLVFGLSIRGIDNFAHLGGFVGGILAGAAAEGFGRRPVTTVVQVVGLIALVALGVVLTVIRTAALTA